MAFCTRCGASLNGAFCSQCGVSVAGAAAPSVRRGTSPMVWVLVVLLCLFVAGILGVIGTGAYVAHRLRRDPQGTMARVLAAHPDLEVIDSGPGGITVRSRRSGKKFSLSFDPMRRGGFHLEAVDDEGRAGRVEVGGDAHVPSWVPQYPGAVAEPVLSARGESEAGAGEAGEFRFTTPDSPDQVLSFYESRGREMGLTLHTVRVGEKVTLATAEDDRDRMLKVIAQRDGDRTSANVTYWRKR
jgi:hypothetical protein